MNGIVSNDAILAACLAFATIVMSYVAALHAAKKQVNATLVAARLVTISGDYVAEVFENISRVEHDLLEEWHGRPNDDDRCATERLIWKLNSQLESLGLGKSKFPEFEELHDAGCVMDYENMRARGYVATNKPHHTSQTSMAMKHRIESAADELRKTMRAMAIGKL